MATQQAEAHCEECSICVANGHCHQAAAIVILSQQMVHWLTNQLILIMRHGSLSFRRALGLWCSSSDT